jgi:lysophospholipid acyltransferase (LPLAT)-like uncharacterized protein
MKSPVESPKKHVVRRSGVVLPNQPRWHQRIVALLILLLERAITCSLRIRWDDRAGIASGRIRGPVIYATWHNRLALSMVVWRKYSGRHLRCNGLAALISASKDGALLAATLEQFGIQPVRGSSSRRGAQALLELSSAIQRNVNVAITPDGPRGPCYQVQPGIVALAQVTGATVVPVVYHASRKLTLKSWDRFQIPLPFARCEIVLGESLTCPADATESQRETFRADLESALKRITRD